MSRGPAAWKSSDVAWRGGRRPYDLLKEVAGQLVLVGVLVALLSLLFASPDPPAATMREWAATAPQDFAITTVSEVDGTSASATYGPPYQPESEQNGSLQGFGWLSPQSWVGARLPFDATTELVRQPLGRAGDTEAVQALDAFLAAPADQQQRWSTAYSKALEQATFTEDGTVRTERGDYGPLPTVVEGQYRFAVSGGLDAALQASDKTTTSGFPVWFSNDQTRSLLYFGDSGQGGGASSCISAGQPLPKPDTCWWYNQSVANAAPRYAGYLAGGTWGVVNEVGNWPGAWWLAPYSFWYQWGYGANGASGDLYAMLLTGAVTMLFLFLPWIPGLRDIPRATGLYRVMWGDYYRLVEREQRAAAADGPPADRPSAEGPPSGRAADRPGGGASR
jgi:hypothetical protein